MSVFKINELFAERYLLSELLGEGVSTEEWKARDQLADDAVVVLKIQFPGTAGSKMHDGNNDEVRQLKHEFSISQHLVHPHMVNINHFDIWKGAAYLVRPYYPQGSLKNLVEEGSTLSEKQLALILCQIGSALKALHQQEPPILHQQLRPENIVILNPEYFLLAGTGSRSSSSNPPEPFNSRGREDLIPYAPPESFDPSRETDTSGDIFSLGVTLYEMCTNTLPWNGAGGQALVKGEEVPALPASYSAELNELLQSCMLAESHRRPGAGELHLMGKHYLETGSWDLSYSGEEESRPMKKIIPFALATAVLVFFIIGAVWEYKNDSLAGTGEKFQKMVSPTNQEDQEIDAMLVEVLEQERKDLAMRNLELEKVNQQLLRKDSINKILLEGREPLAGEFKGKNIPQEQTLDKPKATKVSSTLSAAPKSTKKASLTKDLEQQLNKISDPKISGKARTAWKAETMDQFADGIIRIVDETEGAPKQYSASIFLNLLYNVPHTIVVKEVKTDQNKKVTELRLTMETKM